jgi:hypothetical protein
LWQRLKPDEALTAQMLAAIVIQRTSRAWTKDGGDYIPHPKTWLHQGRWEDAAELDVVALHLTKQTEQAAAVTALWLGPVGPSGPKKLGDS